MRFTFVFCALLLAIASPAAAAPKSLGQFRDWHAFVSGEGAARICYAAAAAEKTQGGAKGRDATTVAVTHRPKSVGEVSLTGSYGFKANAEIEVMVAGMKHAFFAQGNTAWAKDAAADKALVASMIKGRDMVVKATPAKGSAITDTISLAGFSQALAAIDKACGVKR